jgi:hypothetical protein
MTIKALYPTINPTLNLDFANTKTLGPLVTFTRASSGTFVDSNGLLQTAATDVPRFDHNPTTGESLGLLVEEQRTNLQLRSEEFDNAIYSKTRCSISINSIAAPNGATTADKIVEDTSTNSHFMSSSSLSYTSGQSYTLSIFAKAGERNRFRLQLGGGGTPFPVAANHIATFDIALGSVVSAGSALVASIIPYGNGWYRCSITATAQATASDSVFPVALVSSGTTINYTGDGTSGLFIWGAQLEAGAFATSYIPTTTAAATRSADVASITGTNFSSWYRQDEGTVFAEASSYMGSAAVTRGVVSIDGAAGDSHRIFRQSDLQPVIQAFVGNVAQAVFGLGATWSTAASRRISYAYAVNNFGANVDGGTAQTDVSGTLPTTSTLNIGTISGGNQFGGTIRRLTYWPQRLPNSTLQAITQ